MEWECQVFAVCYPGGPPPHWGRHQADKGFNSFTKSTSVREEFFFLCLSGPGKMVSEPDDVGLPQTRPTRLV
jgi:hypothetical protein